MIFTIKDFMRQPLLSENTKNSKVTPIIVKITALIIMLVMTFYLKDTLPEGFSRIFNSLDQQANQSQSSKSLPQDSDQAEYK